MREIKFRFWDANTKVMDYDRRYIPWADEEISVDTFFDTSEESSASVWLQWTGLKDMNGVDIYEGDIFKAPHDFGPGGMDDRVARVHFDIRRGYQWEYWDLDNIEVIGNIYENPELLSQ